MDELFKAFGCAGLTMYMANKRRHLYIVLFASRAKEHYIVNYNTINAVNNQKAIGDQESDAEVLRKVINETAKSFFRSWDSAIQEQQQYMRQNLFMGNLMPSVFIERLRRMNKFLQYFPRVDPTKDENGVLIPEEQLITIVHHHASHGIMQLQIQRSGKTINEFKTLDELKVFFDQQHECNRLEQRLLKNSDGLEKSMKRPKRHKKRRKNNDDETDNAEKNDRKPSAMPRCTTCGKLGHSDDNCWTLEKNAKKRPANFDMAKAIKKKKPKKMNTADAAALFTEEQVSVTMKNVMASMKEKYGDKKTPKHQVHYESSSNSNNDSDKHSSDKLNLYSLEYTYVFDNYKNMEAPTHKLQHVTRYSAEIIVEIVISGTHRGRRTSVTNT
jgi:hypothetical protein